MNKHVLFVAVAISILAGTGIVSQAYAAFTITMETDKDVYDHSSVITVTGHVFPVDTENSDVTIIVKSTSPPGIVQIDQICTNPRKLTEYRCLDHNRILRLRQILQLLRL